MSSDFNFKEMILDQLYVVLNVAFDSLSLEVTRREPIPYGFTFEHDPIEEDHWLHGVRIMCSMSLGVLGADAPTEYLNVSIIAQRLDLYSEVEETVEDRLEISAIEEFDKITDRTKSAIEKAIEKVI